MRNLYSVFKREYVDSFTPFWFVTVMGTGISSNILYSFPYEGRWMRDISYIYFAVACLLFFSFNVIMVLNFCHHGKQVKQFLYNIQHNVFIGTYPMGAITIINYIFFLTQKNFIIGIYTLWWIDVVISVFSAWIVTFYIFRKSDVDMNRHLQGLLLLPVVPLVVAGASAGLFTRDLPFHLHEMTLVITFLMLAMGVGFALLIFPVYLWSLFVNNVPVVGAVFTMFLPLGPMGQGCFGLLLWGDNVHKYMLDIGLEDYIAWPVKICASLMAMTLLAFGFVFTIWALYALLSYRKKISFHKGWWAMTFPLGTMSLGCKEMHIQYGFKAFHVLSAIYSTGCILATTISFFGCAYLFLKGARQAFIVDTDTDGKDSHIS